MNPKTMLGKFVHRGVLPVAACTVAALIGTLLLLQWVELGRSSAERLATELMMPLGLIWVALGTAFVGRFAFLRGSSIGKVGVNGTNEFPAEDRPAGDRETQGGDRVDYPAIAESPVGGGWVSIG